MSSPSVPPRAYPGAVLYEDMCPIQTGNLNSRTEFNQWPRVCSGSNILSSTISNKELGAVCTLRRSLMVESPTQKCTEAGCLDTGYKQPLPEWLPPMPVRHCYEPV